MKGTVGLRPEPWHQKRRYQDIQIYKTGASPEEVFDFYLQKIGGKDSAWNGDPETLAPGTASPVTYEITFYDDTDFTDYQVEGGTHPGTWMKQNLMKSRKPSKPGMWVKEVGYSWFKKEPNGDNTMFYLNIIDTSFDNSDCPRVKYRTGTQIMVQVDKDTYMIPLKGEMPIPDEGGLNSAQHHVRGAGEDGNHHSEDGQGIGVIIG